MSEEQSNQDEMDLVTNTEQGLEDLLDSSDSEDETSVSLSLEASGQPGGFHTANDPMDRFQRTTVTERRGIVDVRCKSKVIIHGSLSPESDDAATLLVYDLNFNATKRFRRIASAKISFEFASSQPNFPGPEVHTIAPYGRWSLLETTQQEHVEKGRDVNLTVGYSGSSLGGSQKWTSSVDRSSKDSTIIIGDTTCNSYGKETGAEFVLLENASASPKIGVPSFLRLAILLRRKTDEEFQCSVNIDVESDWKTSMVKLFARKDQDDPIYFNSELPPVNKLQGFAEHFDEDDLGSTDLGSIYDATFHTTFENSIKKQF